MAECRRGVHEPVIRTDLGSPGKHYRRPEPVIRTDLGSPGKHYIVCGDCGMLLWFVPLEDLGVNTDDWEALRYGTRVGLTAGW